MAGERLQGVVPDGARFWVLAPEVALAQRGDAAAGAAGQGGVTAPQGGLRTGGGAGDRVERRLEENRVTERVNEF